MSLINIHDTVSSARVEPLSLAQDRGKSEVRIGDLTSDVPFRAGVEYTPPARGTWTIAHTPMLVPGSMEIFVCPDGCLRGVVLSAAEFDGMDRFAMITVKEGNLYDGRMDQLIIDGVTDILEHRDSLPTAVLLFCSCIHKMIYTDTKYVYKTLRERFPTVDFIECYMDCTMRKSKIFYEEAVNRQLYDAIRPRPRNPKAVNIIGNYFSLYPKSELLQMFQANGWTVRELPNLKTYEQYQEMGEAVLDIYTHPLGGIAAKTLADRTGTNVVYAPYAWDYGSIEQGIRDAAEAAGLPCPDFAAERQKAEKALAGLRDSIGEIEVQIDAAGTPRPLELARLLLSHGFRVTAVYLDAISGEETAARDWLRVHHPDLKIRSIVNFRGRTNPRDEAERLDGQLLAIGQKAAYFTGTKHFVNLIYNRGLHGYAGIVRLCELMEEAVREEKETREIIQVKAWGCHG